MSAAAARLLRRLGLASALLLAAWLTGCATTGADGAPAAVVPQPTLAAAGASATAVLSTAPLPIVAPTDAPDTLQADGQAYLFPLDPLRPSVIIDADDVSVHTDLWARVRAGFAMPELENDLVIKWQQWYASRPDYVSRMTERGARYLFYVVEEIEKRGIPTELALLPFIESAFNPQAMSSARASGMWQFMPATGKDFDLKQNLFRDDRRDVLASTRAALDYLQMLQRQFGDWQLALAAYNWGQGNVQRAVDRNLKAGIQPTYENLRMPDETRNYVPKLQAVKNIVLRPQSFSISLPVLENHPYFLSVPIVNDIDVDVAARLANISLDEFQQLNPQMNKPVILAAGTPQVLLPYDNATLFVRNLRAHQSPLASWTAWVAPATLKTGEVARQVGMSESELLAVNRIPPQMLVKAGSTLLVPRSPNKQTDVSEHLADNARMLLAPDRPPGRRVSFKAGKKGDSVAAVAKRYGFSIDQVAQWNAVEPGASFKAGQTILIVLSQPVRGKRASAAAPTPAKAASPARRTAAAEAAKPAKPARTAAHAKRTAASKPAVKPAAKLAVTKPDAKL
ncbi:MAG TPA: transglycosylase SLT domain-containing protein [Rubrivivax sp.]|nr:transglycosylase SLT domain-containing protein [Rubrivivax sp.]